MTEKVTSILDIPAATYTPEKEPSETLKTERLREKLESRGYKMPDLDVPFDIVESYLDGASSSADLSIKIISRVLPIKLTPVLSKADREEKEGLRATYQEINDLINESRESTYEKLIQQVTKEKLFEITPDTPRIEIINNLFKYFDKTSSIDLNEEPSGEMKKLITEFTEDTWYLTLLNHRLILREANRTYSQLNRIGILTDREDVFQEALAAGFEMASQHDPERGSLTNYLSKYLGSRIERFVLKSDELSVHDIKTTLRARYEAHQLLNQRQVSDYPEKLRYLTAFFYYQNTGGIEYTGDDPLIGAGILKNEHTQ